jgi:hypothetical protein
MVYCNDYGEEWWVNGKRHRDGGEPAVLFDDGIAGWWVDGVLHRDGDMPALVVLGPKGGLEWWVHGKRHRDGDLPAVKLACGTKQWWKDGKGHREHDFAVIHHDGTTEKWLEGMRLPRRPAVSTIYGRVRDWQRSYET